MKRTQLDEYNTKLNAPTRWADPWDNLDFEQKMDIDPIRAIDDEESEYLAEMDRVDRLEMDRLDSDKQRPKDYEFSYFLCGYSKDFLHLEKKVIKEDGDYYETIIVSIKSANFL